MLDRANQRGLAIAPTGAFDPGAFRCAAGTTVCANEEAAAQLFARIKGHGHAAGRHGLSNDRTPRKVRYAVGGLHRVKQDAAQVAVLHHVAHRTFFDLGMIEMHEKR